MGTSAQPRPSFSPYRKWRIGLNVFLLSLVALSVVVMANFLSRDYFTRIYLNERTKIKLHPRTLKLLEAITNEVKVTLYYDKNEELYSTVAELLDAYARVNHKISIETVDYQRDPAGAQKVKEHYRLTSAMDKNLVIFDCEGKMRPVNANSLAEYTLEPMREEGEPKYRRKPLTFRGEMMFTSVLLAVTSPKPLKAYFLQGHGEHVIDSADDSGYMKLASALKQNFIEVAALSLLGSNGVPTDCSLLVAGGPKAALLPAELEKVERYLNEGGRMLALFNTRALDKETGLEQILAHWGVRISGVIVTDPEHSQDGSDVIVSAFSKHPLVNPLLGNGLYLDRPRPVSGPRTQPTGGPRVETVAFSGEHAFMEGDPNRKQYRFPLMVTVERGDIKGVSSERGATRAVVAGDSVFLDNAHIDYLANRDFAVSAMDWLLDRTQLVEGLGAHPVKEWNVIMTKAQYQQAQWILLAGMPGGVLLLGGLVWIRRRK